MDYGERMEKAKFILIRKEKLNEILQTSLDKVNVASKNIENILYKYKEIN